MDKPKTMLILTSETEKNNSPTGLSLGVGWYCVDVVHTKTELPIGLPLKLVHHDSSKGPLHKGQPVEPLPARRDSGGSNEESRQKQEQRCSRGLCRSTCRGILPPLKTRQIEVRSS